MTHTRYVPRMTSATAGMTSRGSATSPTSGRAFRALAYGATIDGRTAVRKARRIMDEDTYAAYLAAVDAAEDRNACGAEDGDR